MIMTTMEQKRLFCFGYGYCSEYVGHALTQQGNWKIMGTTRDTEKRRELLRRGVKSYLFDQEHPLGDPYFILDGVTHLLISTPPGDDGDPVFQLHADAIASCKTLEWVGYLSSTAVYGDRDGGYVTENSEIRPTNKRGSRRALAEQQFLSLWQAYGLPLHIFRLSGIYGPSRSALDSVRAGVARRIHKPGHAFNRIHVEDIVQVILASIAQPNPGTAYNLADDNPVPSHEVIAYACELLGLEVPPLLDYNETDMAPIARSFYKDNKRVNNDKIKQELGVHLKYPDYRAGLEACLAVEQALGGPILVDTGSGE